jgi:hypothetical protein
MIWTLLLSAALALPVDRALRYSDAGAGESAHKAALEAARIGARMPRRLHRYANARAGAWTSVGRLQVLDADIAGLSARALLEPNNPPVVRTQAAWAMGEISRGRSWSEARTVALPLQKAMSGRLDASTAYYVVEAFGKAYTPHDHSFEENLAANRALNALSANQTTQLPPIYYVVLDRVLTMDVAIKLLRDLVGEARGSRSEQKLAEVYAAVLTNVRWISSRQTQLITGYAEQKQAVGAAFDALLSTLDLEDRRLTLMLVWAMGDVAADPSFAALAGPRLAARADSKDPVARMLAAWSLYRLRTDLAARGALREVYLSREMDDRIFDMLTNLRTSPEEMDVVQKLYEVQARP